MKKHPIETLIETAQFFFEKMPASEAQTNITVKISEVLKDLKTYQTNLNSGEMVCNSVNSLEIANKVIDNIANKFGGITRLDLLEGLSKSIDTEIANTEAALGAEYIERYRNANIPNDVKIVQSATEPTFKVGDRVKLNGGSKEYRVYALGETVAAIICGDFMESVKYTDLTLITE
jgi:hypothetical protein